MGVRMLKPWDYDNDTLGALAASMVSEALRHPLPEKYLIGKNGLFTLALYAFSHRRLKKSLLIAELGVRLSDRMAANAAPRPISLTQAEYERVADQARRFLHLLPPATLLRTARPYQAGVTLSSSFLTYGEHQRFISRLISLKPAGAILSYRLMDIASLSCEEAEKAVQTYFFFVEAWGRLVQPKAKEWLQAPVGQTLD